MSDRSRFWLNMGKIIGAHGIKGQLKVYSYTRPITQILSYKTWYLTELEKPWLKAESDIDNLPFTQTIKILKGSEKSNATLIVSADSIVDRNVSESLNGNYIYVNASQLPALKDDFYWFELIGFNVFNTQGETFGKVSDFFDNGANDVMVTRIEDDTTDKAKEFYLPYDKQYIVKIDTIVSQIVVDWPFEL